MRTFRSWNSFNEFATVVKKELRFVRVTRQEQFLKTVLDTSHSRTDNLHKGSTLWRAQLKSCWRRREIDGREIQERCAVKPERMKPCPRFASDGRANPRGIPYLYLATEKKTAILEVRPWIGSYVSIARFQIVKDSKILNCTKDDLNFINLTWERHRKSTYKVKAEDCEKMVWSEINRAFSTPSQREDNSVDYAPTQMLSEFFKTQGFGGIAYKSSFGENGFNIALFDIDAADIVGRVSLCRVDDIDIKITTENL